MTTLTIELDDATLATLRTEAKQQNTTIEALVRGRLAARPTPPRITIPPGSNAAKALGILPLPAGQSDAELLTEALLERHGVRP